MSDQRCQPTAMPHSMQLMQLIFPGVTAVQAIYVAAKLAIADTLERGPMSSEELALATQTHAPSLRRVLRALTTLGIFAEDATGRFRQTTFASIPIATCGEGGRIHGDSRRRNHGANGEGGTPIRATRPSRANWAFSGGERGRTPDVRWARICPE